MIALPEKKRKIIVWILLIVLILPGLNSGLISPALPAISKSFHATKSTIQFLMTAYLLGYASGNFIFGLFIDEWHRRKILLFSLFGFTIATLVPVIYQNVIILVFCGLIQGLIMGALGAASRTIMADVHPANQRVHVGTLIGTTWGAGPVLGPVIGGYLQFYLGWSACFIFFALMTFASFVAVFYNVPETHETLKKINGSKIKNNLKEIFTNKYFMALALMSGTIYSVIIVFISLGSFLIQDTLRYSSVSFGYMALGMGVILWIAAMIAHQLSKSFVPEKLVPRITVTVCVLFLVGFIFSLFFHNNIYFILLLSALMHLAAGMISTLVFGLGLGVFPRIPGLSSSALYLVDVLTMTFVSLLIGVGHFYSATSLMIIYASLLCICFILNIVIIKTRPNIR